MMHIQTESVDLSRNRAFNSDSLIIEINDIISFGFVFRLKVPQDHSFGGRRFDSNAIFVEQCFISNCTANTSHS